MDKGICYKFGSCLNQRWDFFMWNHSFHCVQRLFQIQGSGYKTICFYTIKNIKYLIYNSMVISYNCKLFTTMDKGVCYNLGSEINHRWDFLILSRSLNYVQLLFQILVSGYKTIGLNTIKNIKMSSIFFNGHKLQL